jgi:DNA repair protein RecO (recombination protein O)
VSRVGTDEAGWLLHSRPYRETSLLVDVFTREHGCLRLVARGVRGHSAGARQKRSLLQPFVPLHLGWRGRHELKTLVAVEARGASARLAGPALYCGLYVNELLERVLQPADAHPEVFDRYQALLPALASARRPEPCLREFELSLLAALGYGVALTHDATSGQPISPTGSYRFVPETGLVAAGGEADTATVFSGAHLLAMARREWGDVVVRQAAKRLTRQMLAPVLGTRPLVSRELFRAVVRPRQTER